MRLLLVLVLAAIGPIGLAPIGLTLCPAHAADGDLKGWRDLPFGTTLAEAQRAHPCAQTQAPAERGGATCRLLDPVKIRNLSFGAVLGFDDAGLDAATLSLLPVGGDVGGQLTEQVYALLCLDAARKYGAPSLQIEPRLGRDRVGGMVWKFGGGGYLSIALEGDRARQLTLAYHSGAHLPPDP